MRGSIKKRFLKDGTAVYDYLIYLGSLEDGKKKYKRKRGFKTQQECEAALTEAINKINKGITIADDKITISEYLDKWMKIYAKKNCKHTTYKRYETFTKQIKEYLGTCKLSKLTPMAIQEFYADLQNERNISNNTIIKTHRMLHTALKQAQRWQLIYVNPADLVTTPKADPIEMKYWNPEDISDYLDLLKDEPLYPIIFLALHTGMRESELCGLRWQDIDIINKTLHVNMQLQREDGILILDTLKSKNSNRIVTLFDSTIQLLKSMKREDKELKLSTKLEPNFVFHWSDIVEIKDKKNNKYIKCYRPIDPHYVSEQFPEILAKYINEDGEILIPKIRFHDLRHTHGTLLRKLGTDPKVISERLGHYDVAFTLKTYTHVNTDMQREEVSKAEEFLK